jgi:pyruvate/2-oxoglutarate dehydrogenase complex dihydrolipoamide acyltransferase (E2) component
MDVVMPRLSDSMQEGTSTRWLVAEHRMTITLTCDHRILHGADAAAFLADIRANLEQPLRLAL